MSKQRARPGDIFQIPLDDERVGYGIVVEGASPAPVFVAVYPATGSVREAVPLRVLQQTEEPVFLAWILDAKIWHGHWPIVDRVEVDRSRFVFPSYKQAVGRAGNMEVFSFDGVRHRRATPEEEGVLSFKETFAPVVLEKATRAFHGLLPWEPRFDRLRVEQARRCAIDV